MLKDTVNIMTSSEFLRCTFHSHTIWAPRKLLLASKKRNQVDTRYLFHFLQRAVVQCLDVKIKKINTFFCWIKTQTQIQCFIPKGIISLHKIKMHFLLFWLCISDIYFSNWKHLQQHFFISYCIFNFSLVKTETVGLSLTK